MILQKPYKSYRALAETLIKICICLTCIKIRNTPLIRDTDTFDPDPSFSEEEEVDEENNQSQPRVLTTKATRGKKAQTNNINSNINNNENREKANTAQSWKDIPEGARGKIVSKSGKK